MRFTADRASLLEAVGRVHSAAGNGKSIPILGMALLRTEGDRLAVRCTDSTIEATAYALASVETEGAVCVPASQLHDLLRALPEGGELGMTQDASDARLALVCGRSRFKLPTLPAADFPMLPDERDAVSGVVKSRVLARLLDKTLFAAANEEVRYYLRGIFLHRVDGQASTLLRSVATDGTKLAKADDDCPSSLAAMAGVIVPTRLATEMRRCLGSLDCDVELSVSASRVGLTVGETRVVGQTVAGSFPDYPRVIPQAPANVASVDIGLLRHALRRVSVAAQPSEKSKMRVVRVALSPGAIGLSARSAERGEAQEDVEAAYGGPAMTFSLDGGQLLAIAERFDGAALELGLGESAADPLLITDPADATSQFVLMPVRA